MQIILEIKKTGFANNQVIYPVCAKSKTFAQMLDQKSFTQENLQQIKSLGFVIIYK
jgi:hypothetical protein